VRCCACYNSVTVCAELMHYLVFHGGWASLRVFAPVLSCAVPLADPCPQGMDDWDYKETSN
jgi:hypothetical protein